MFMAVSGRNGLRGGAWWTRVAGALTGASRTLSAARYGILARSISSRLHRRTTQKLRVAIGPVRGAPSDSVVGPRVLLVADWLNRRSRHFRADFFFKARDLLKRQYDAAIVVKNFDDFQLEHVQVLKRRGTQLLYSIADNPGGGMRSYVDAREFLEEMDAIIAANPLQVADLGELAPKTRLIPAPLRNTRSKAHYNAGRPLRLIWQGYVENASLTAWLHPLVAELDRSLPGGVELVYHANLPVDAQPPVKFRQWRLADWEDVLIGADIAIAVKPEDNWYQQRKPPTKVLTYMAAGLPVICTPSEADRLIVRNGLNALTASGAAEWRDAIVRLARDETLRRSLGRAGQRDALRFASLNVVGRAHEKLLLSLTGGAGWRRL